MIKYLVPALLLLTGCAAHRHEVNPYLVEPSSTYLPPPKVASVPSHYESKAAITVFLDPGHGGQDKGTSSKAKRLVEKNLNLETARRRQIHRRG